MVPQEFLAQWPALAFFGAVVAALLGIIRQQYVGEIARLEELLKAALAQLEKERADHIATRDKASASMLSQVERLYGAVDTLTELRQELLARPPRRTT